MRRSHARTPFHGQLPAEPFVFLKKGFVGFRGTLGAADGHRLLGSGRRHGEGHRDAVVAAGVHTDVYKRQLLDKKRSGDSITLVLCKGVGRCILRRMPFDELRALTAKTFA